MKVDLNFPKNRDVLSGLVKPDTHAPYHSKRATKVLMEVAGGERWDFLIDLGDAFDLHEISLHPKSPEFRWPFDEEVKRGNDFMDKFCSAVGPKVPKYMTEGNHETRLSRYMMKNAPMLEKFVSWQSMFRMEERGFKVCPYNRVLKVGKLNVSHDFGFHGKTAPQGTMSVLRDNSMFGHTHQAIINYKGFVGGESKVSATMGWLGDPKYISYRHRAIVEARSQLGFGIIHVIRGGNFWLQFVPIVNNKCVVNGNLYKG